MSLQLAFVMLMGFSSWAQNLTVKGTVSDETGQPLVGVGIKIKQRNVGAITNSEGKFSISVAKNETLVFSFIGYVTAEKVIVNAADLKINLEPSKSNLDEIIIVGYGAVRKIDLTGSVSQIKMNDITKAPVSNFQEALAGRVAGVTVQSADGQPGGVMDIVIRGANSLTQENSPLYVIDGFPIENPDQNALNPDDIESINILKDASSTAIYGARGANGVILIETKKGKIGKPAISFNTSFGVQNLRKQMELMSPYEFVKYQLQYNADANTQYLSNGKTLESYKDLQGYDWQDYVFRTGFRSLNDISVRGGTDETRYSFSGSYNDQKGVIENSGSRRYQGRLSIDQKISKKIRTGLILNATNTQSYGQRIADGAGTTSSFTTFLLYRVWGYRPISGNNDVDLINDDYDPEAVSNMDARINPVISNENEYDKRNLLNIMGNGYLNYTINKKLSLRINGTISLNKNDREIFNNTKTISGSPRVPFNLLGVNGRINNIATNVLSNENVLTYKNKFGRLHDITGTLGFSTQKVQTKYNSFAAQDIPNESLGIDGIAQGTPYLIDRDNSENTLASFFGRINYGYKSKYLLTATFRYDGSSKFSKANRWSMFPSISAAWNMNEENFLKQSRAISNAKLRLSYGLSGNNRVGDFSNRSSFNQTQYSAYSFDNGTPTKSIIPTALGNENLKWETTKQLNIGYDLGLFKNRIEIIIDAYRKTTNDLLLKADLPKTSGFLTTFKNVGSIRNDGLEFTLNTINIHRPNFTWSSNFNISFNKNKVLALTEGKTYLTTNSPLYMDGAFNMPLYISKVGQPAGLFYGYVFEGIYQYSDFDQVSPGVYYLKSGVPTNGSDRNVIQPGDIKYKDVNGDGVVNDQDLTVIGRGLPVHTGGFTNNFTYKGFDLNVFFQWSYGNDIINANRLVLEGQTGTTRFNVNQFASYANRWSPTNPSNELFRAGGQGPIGRYSSRVIEDGSYLRLKTVSLGYNIKGKPGSKLKFNNLRIYASAQNLLTFTNYTGMDPEVAVGNTVLTPSYDFSAYPQSRTIIFGLNIKL